MRSRSPPAPVRRSPGSRAGPCPPPGPSRSARSPRLGRAPRARGRSRSPAARPGSAQPPLEEPRGSGSAPAVPNGDGLRRPPVPAAVTGPGREEGKWGEAKGKEGEGGSSAVPLPRPGLGGRRRDSPAVRCWRPVPRCAAAAPRLSPALWSLARKSPVRGGRPPIGRRWRELSAGGGATPNRERGRAPPGNRDPPPRGRARSGPIGPVPLPGVRKGPVGAPRGGWEGSPGSPGTGGAVRLFGNGTGNTGPVVGVRNEREARNVASWLPSQQPSSKGAAAPPSTPRGSSPPGAQNLTGSSKPYRELEALPGAQGPAVVLREASKIRAASCRAPEPCAWSPRKRGRGCCCGTESRAGPGGCFPLNL